MNIFRKLTAKPWLPEQAGAVEEDNGFDLPAAKIGLNFFLAVVTVLFFLSMVAYWMRMELPDWQPLTEPQLLWLNTGILVFASIALQWARSSVRKGQSDGLKTGMLIGGALTVAFLVGQYAAWKQLGAAGYYADSNPANAFFYMITALHGIHMLGGLVAWARVVPELFKPDTDMAELCTRVELCTTYWHYLLLVWVVLFGLLLAT